MKANMKSTNSGECYGDNHSCDYMAKRIAELEHTNGELQSVLKHKEELVAALCHDLKSPLLGSSQLLKMLQDGEIESQEYGSVFAIMLDSQHSMLRMVWNLLDTYKCNSASLVPVNDFVNIPLLLEQCLSEFACSIEIKQLCIEAYICKDIPLVLTDKNLIRRVVGNVVDNAIKFTPAGGRLVISLDCDSDKLVITVKDSGPGMTEQCRERIFQRCWQEKRSQANEFGTGLGMYISKQIIDTLGGSIECASAVNEGAQFTLSLPVRTV